MNDPLPPQKYAEQVLGNAATIDQLGKLFELHAAAHPVVTHDVVAEVEIRGEWWHNIKRCKVEILNRNPHSMEGGPVSVIASGQALCSPDDQWQKRRGVEIAFGRALEALRSSVEGPRPKRPPKAAELSTARIMELLTRRVEGSGEGVLGLGYRPGSGWVVWTYLGEKGQERQAYGDGEHLREALLPAARDCGLVAKEGVRGDAPAT